METRTKRFISSMGKGEILVSDEQKKFKVVITLVNSEDCHSLTILARNTKEVIRAITRHDWFEYKHRYTSNGKPKVKHYCIQTKNIADFYVEEEME